MFEYILKNSRNTYALDQNEGLKSFENTKNIDEILKTYNNIEEMELIHTVVNNQYDEKLTEIKRKYKKVVLWVIIYSLLAVIFKLPYQVVMLVMTIPMVKTLVFSVKENKLKKQYEQKLSTIEKEIEEENKKLEYLKKTDTKIEIKSEQPKVILERSDEVEFLYSKLSCIDLVLRSKKELKKLDKAGLLYYALIDSLSKEEIEYIRFLLNKPKENNKVKQLKK